MYSNRIDKYSQIEWHFWAKPFRAIYLAPYIPALKGLGFTEPVIIGRSRPGRGWPVDKVTGRQVDK
jgi:hypothetical protein